MANNADFTADNGNMTLAVRRLSATTVSTLMNGCVLLALLHMMTNQKADAVLGVGDPDVQTVLSGARLDPVRMEELDQDGRYEPLVETIYQSDFKRMVYRDTQPTPSVLGSSASLTPVVVDGVITSVTVSNAGTGYTGSAPTLIVLDALGSAGNGAVLVPTMSSGTFASVAVKNGGHGYASSGVTVLINAGYSEGEKYARPVFKWSKMRSQAQIYDSDIDSAIAMVKSATAEGPVMSVVNDAIKRQIATQAQEICNDLWYGVPTDQTLQYWDQQFGLLATIDDGSGGYASNIWAGVDRTLAANYWARSMVDSSSHGGWGLKDLVDDAHLNKGLAFKDGEVDIFITDPTLFARFKSELVSYTQEVNLGQNEALREIGMYGFNKTALKYGGTYCIPDWRCPKGTVIGLNSKTIKIQFKKGVKFSPSKMYDQHGIPGGIDGSVFNVTTQYRLVCDAPMLNVKYTAIS